MKLPKLFQKERFKHELFFLLKKSQWLELQLHLQKNISRKYKFHVLKRKIADFFEPSEILFGQIQCL